LIYPIDFRFILDYFFNCCWIRYVYERSKL